MNRPLEFKKELIALLEKYDAQLVVTRPQSYIEDESIEVTFNSLWDGTCCIDEFRTLNLGTSFIPHLEK